MTWRSRRAATTTPPRSSRATASPSSGAAAGDGHRVVARGAEAAPLAVGSGSASASPAARPLGLLFGERTAALQIVADAYIKLLQMTVLPYVTVSIVGGLGALDAAQARTLGEAVGLVLVVLWAVGARRASCCSR